MSMLRDMNAKAIAAVVGLMALTLGCAGGANRQEALEMHDALSDLCYRSAGEVIGRKASDVNTLYFSPPSAVKGDWDFELFYGTVDLPRTWGGIAVQMSFPEVQKVRSPGSYEVRYTSLPVQKKIRGTLVTFHGVRQEVVELASGDVIARRENYMWGEDFNRSSLCLGADWYAGNDGFLERVLGARYKERPRVPTPERYVKATLVAAVDETVELKDDWYQQKNALPPGSSYDYNSRSITLAGGGRFYMPQFWTNEPIPYAGTIVAADHYVFIMLPNGSWQNWPLRQILLAYRDRQGVARKFVYVQIPPVVDWSNGWGMRAADVTVAQDRVQLSIYGKKVRTGEFSDQSNAGRYHRRYTFTAALD
jgi:hypothetical protein